MGPIHCEGIGVTNVDLARTQIALLFSFDLQFRPLILPAGQFWPLMSDQETY
jgi:hypothetical protein